MTSDTHTIEGIIPKKFHALQKTAVSESDRSSSGNGSGSGSGGKNQNNQNNHNNQNKEELGVGLVLELGSGRGRVKGINEGNTETQSSYQQGGNQKKLFSSFSTPLPS